MTSTTQTVPDQHSDIVGGSTAGRRLNCPASYALEQRVPKDKGSAAANKGTTFHEMMTILLTDTAKDPADMLPFSFTHKDGWTDSVDEKEWEALGQPALDAFLDYMDEIEAYVHKTNPGAEFIYIIEKSCELPGIPGAFGTADVIWKCGNLSGVWDWKFGYGEVKAEDNPQLKFYGRAAMNTHPEMFEGCEEVELAIMQPARRETPDTWLTYPDELEEFRVELVAAVQEAQELGESARMEKGKHCAFARCKAVCPLYINPTLELGKKLAALKERREQAPEGTAVPAMQNEPEFRDDLPTLLEMAEAAEDYVKSIFALAHDLAENDPEMRERLRENDWVLKDKKRGARAYVVDEAKVMNGARYRGLKIDDFAPRKLISPTQLEKELKKLGKELPKDWAEQPPSSGTTLVRAAAGVQEHVSRSEKFATLGEKLAHLR